MDKKELTFLFFFFLVGCTFQNNIAGLVPSEQLQPIQQGWNFFSAPVSETLSSTVDLVLYNYENGQWQVKNDRILVGGKAY